MHAGMEEGLVDAPSCASLIREIVNWQNSPLWAGFKCKHMNRTEYMASLP